MYTFSEMTEEIYEAFFSQHLQWCRLDDSQERIRFRRDHAYPKDFITYDSTIGNGVLDRPSEVTVTDGGGNIKSQTRGVCS
jgi:hypothetical protein